MSTASELLRLLQLTNASLPIGAFSYSEGIETLVDAGRIKTPDSLQTWLADGLTLGAVRIEAAVMLRARQAALADDAPAVRSWNDWLGASRETRELYDQSVQMGRSLLRLLASLPPGVPPWAEAWTDPCHFPIAFGLAAAVWEIEAPTAALGYLQSWAANLVSAAVRLVPLGHTDGQRVLAGLAGTIETAAESVLAMADDDLAGSNWGLALASMSHETLYCRLFRS
ncbi:MAG: urease accessory protein UreF [Candidatus Sericytochromatia bacterium]|nr:urease accessory protein UreF [Candidatus Sericytochromatia bacterium]